MGRRNFCGCEDDAYMRGADWLIAPQRGGVKGRCRTCGLPVHDRDVRRMLAIANRERRRVAVKWERKLAELQGERPS